MELPKTEQGNRYVIVFQDFMTKWPLVFPAPDQKAIRLTKLVAEELLTERRTIHNAMGWWSD